MQCIMIIIIKLFNTAVTTHAVHQNLRACSYNSKFIPFEQHLCISSTSQILETNTVLYFYKFYFLDCTYKSFNIRPSVSCLLSLNIMPSSSCMLQVIRLPSFFLGNHIALYMSTFSSFICLLGCLSWRL